MRRTEKLRKIVPKERQPDKSSNDTTNWGGLSFWRTLESLQTQSQSLMTGTGARTSLTLMRSNPSRRRGSRSAALNYIWISTMTRTSGMIGMTSISGSSHSPPRSWLLWRSTSMRRTGSHWRMLEQRICWWNARLSLRLPVKPSREQQQVKNCLQWSLPDISWQLNISGLSRERTNFYMKPKNMPGTRENIWNNHEWIIATAMQCTFYNRVSKRLLFLTTRPIILCEGIYKPDHYMYV